MIIRTLAIVVYLIFSTAVNAAGIGNLLGSGQNKGSTVQNVSSPSSGSNAFTDYAKYCAIGLGGYNYPTNLNANGYFNQSPQESASAWLVCGINPIVNNPTYGGHWVISWTGSFGVSGSAPSTPGQSGVGLANMGAGSNPPYHLYADSGCAADGSHLDGNPGSDTGCTYGNVVSNNGGLLKLSGQDGYVEFDTAGGTGTTITQFQFFRGNGCTTVCDGTGPISAASGGITGMHFYRKDQEGARFTGSITDNGDGTGTLTVSVLSSGTVTASHYVLGPGITNGMQVLSGSGSTFIVKPYAAVTNKRMSTIPLFNPDYIAFLKKLNPGVLRTGLAWGSSPGQFFSNYDYSTAVTSANWVPGTKAFYKGAWAGGANSTGHITSSSGVTYTASNEDDIGPSSANPSPCNNASYCDGETIQGFVSDGFDAKADEAIGYISTNVLTITGGCINSNISIGHAVMSIKTGADRPNLVSDGTIITDDHSTDGTLTGTGCAGTYRINNSQTVYSVGAPDKFNLVPTLNVGGRGVVPVRGPRSGAIYTGMPNSNETIRGNQVSTFIYDAILNVWLHDSDGLTPTVPMTAQIDLCNAVGADCWLVMPIMYNLTGFSKAATAINNQLATNTNVYFEYGDENFGDNYNDDAYLTGARAYRMGFPNNAHDYYGFRQRQYLSILKSINPTKFHGVMTTNVNPPPSDIGNVCCRLGGYNAHVDSNNQYTTGGNASIQGYISGTTLHVTQGPTAPQVVSMNMGVTGNGTSTNTTITNYVMPASGGGKGGSGTNAVGSYSINNSQTICSSGSPCTFTLTGAGSGNAIAIDYSNPGSCNASITSGRPVDCVDYFGTNNYYVGPNFVGDSAKYGASDTDYTGQHSSIAISDITQANPACVHAVATNYPAGARVWLKTNTTWVGMPELTDAWITVAPTTGACTLDADHFPISNARNNLAYLTVDTNTPVFLNWSNTTLTAGNAVKFIVAPIDVAGGPDKQDGILPSPLSSSATYYISLTGLTTSHVQIAANQTDALNGVNSISLGTLTGKMIGYKILSSDSTTYSSAYVSGGRSSLSEPHINDKMLSMVDLYATGDAANQKTALDWVRTDSNTLTPVPGTGIHWDANTETVALSRDDTTLYNFTQASGRYWNLIATIMAAYPSIKYVSYEGGYNGGTMTPMAAAELAIDPSYPNKMNDLLNGFFASDQFRLLQNDYQQAALNYSGINSRALSQSADLNTSLSETSIWGYYNTNSGIYAQPYYPGSTCPSTGGNTYCFAMPRKSFDAQADFNSGRRWQ